MAEPTRSADEPNDTTETNTRTARKLSKLDDAAYAARAHTWLRDCMDHETNARKAEDEDFQFYSGHQWKDDVRDEAAAKRRPTLTLNYTLPVVNAVTGEERMNRQQISVLGRDDSDDPGAFVLTETIRWVMDRCNGEYAISKAFRSTVIGGRSWLEVTMNYLDDVRGRPVVNAIKRQEIWLDPLSELEDASDARFLIRERWLSEDEIESMWPDSIEDLRNARESADTYGATPASDRGDAYRGKTKTYRAKDGTWQVLEVWHFEVVPGALALNPDTGSLEELTKDELDALLKREQEERAAYEQASLLHSAFAVQAATAGADPTTIPPPPIAPQPLEYREVPIKRYFQGFVCGDKVLQRGDAPVSRLKRFPYIPIFGMRDDEDECWFGVVRPIKDAQRQHNVEQSTILHWTQTSPKGGWMGPKGSFVDRTRWEQRSAQSGVVLEYNPSRGKPEEIKPPSLPRHMVELMPARLQAMRDISGVNVDIMGTAGRGDPGVVMEMRRKQGLTVLETLFDNLRLSRRVLGEVLIAYIQEFIADDRRIRVVGPKAAKYVVLSRDLQFAEFDAVVEDTQDTPTDKMATLHILQTTLPMLMKSGIPIPPSFVDVLPIAPHIREEWKALIQSFMGVPPAAAPTPPPSVGAASAAPVPPQQ
ncbi:MAG: hypothetical protein AB7P02_12670 [Alphaproteobacteria bacterium]